MSGRKQSNVWLGLTLLAGCFALMPPPAEAAEPASGTDITGKTVYLAPNARLRYGESLLSRVYSRSSAALELKGRGPCTVFNCPVAHNNVSLFARRSRLETEKPSGPVVTERTLRSGDEGEDVRIMQQALVKKGYTVTVDGKFGNSTEQAVRDFQQKSGLTVDGEIGSQTRDKLSV